MARQPAPPAPPAPPVTLPPCQSGYRCTDYDRPISLRAMHKDDCAMSEGMSARRAGRIDGLTEGEMRSALVFLSGWSPTAVDFALADADDLRVAGLPDGAL